MYKSDDQNRQNKVIQLVANLTPEALLKAGKLKSVTISKERNSRMQEIAISTLKVK